MAHLLEIGRGHAGLGGVLAGGPPGSRNVRPKTRRVVSNSSGTTETSGGGRRGGALQSQEQNRASSCIELH
jgi:hypothetical protein